MPSTLSICVMTAGPPGRVRALLELCRPVADEVVLVVDRSGDLGTLEACRDLADQRHVVDSSSVVRVLGWMLQRCRGDWILRLDDDEIPSAALLAGLPDHCAQPHHTNVALHRRWLYGDVSRYITTPEWTPDYQVRLVRNVPGLWRFSGLVHAGLEVQGPRRFSEQPIYHADALLLGVEARRAKRAAMVALRPDVAAINELYVPEDHDVRTALVPPEDQARIAGVLAGRYEPGHSAAAAPPAVVTPATFERHLAGRDILPGAYAGTVRLDTDVGTLVAGAIRQVDVVVHNRGSEWWDAGDDTPGLRVGYRWRTADAAAVVDEGRMLFSETVLPGRASRLWTALRAPAAPGRYLLEIGLVHEHVRWFGEGTTVPVEVVDS